MTTNTNAAQVAKNLIAVAEDQAFEAWYKQDCLVGGVNARIAARAAWNARAALTTAAPQPCDIIADAVRVPLDSLHADAEWLCARLLDKSLTREEVVTAIRSRIDAAKAALTTAAAAVPAIPDAITHTIQRALVKFSDSELERLRTLLEPKNAAVAMFGTARIAAQQNIDDADAALNWLAAAPKAEPVQAGEYPPMPQTAIDAMLDYIYEHGTSAEGVKERIESMLRAYVDADRAMRAQAAPKQEAGTYHLGACITDGMLHATVMRKAPGSAGAVTVLLSEAIPVGSLQDHDVVVDAATQAAPTSSASVEITDEQMHQGLAAAFAHPRAAAPDAVFKAGVDFGVSVALLQTAPTTQAAPQLPERDASVSAEQQGLFRKFDVRRVDGTDKPGGKHHGCRYFVLDVDHDPCARAALTAYAAACEATHPVLAADLRTKWGAMPTTQAAPVAQGDAEDPLQGAAQWLLEALEGCNIADLQSRLLIGFNRAQRLMLAALAARAKTGEGVTHG